MVPRQTDTCTSTLPDAWPIRNARSFAWFSTDGFHQRSKWITCDAAGRVPAPCRPPSTKGRRMAARRRARNWSTSCLRRPTANAAHRKGQLLPRPKDYCAESAKRFSHFAELGEDQGLLLPPRISSQISARPRELSPLFFRVKPAVAQQLRGVVALMLEAHQIRENQSAAADAFQSFERCGQFPIQLSRTGAACRLPSPQNARTSVLSGRSTMTRLSVFSRRRI